MKYSSLLLSILGLLAHTAPAHSAQVWAEGVTQTSGWIDYEKVYGSGDGDDYLCWAASASNIIDYWQQHYIVPSGTPTGEAIWNTFKSSIDIDTGGHFIYAMQWWLGGDYEGTTLDNDVDASTSADNRAVSRHQQVDSEGKTVNPAIKTNLDVFDGYYWDLIPDTYQGVKYTNSQQCHLYDFLNLGVDYTSTAQSLISQLSGAPVSLSIANDLTGDYKLAHAITLWGLEYDDTTDTISTLWITDSDDYKTQLKQVGVYYDTSSTTDKLYLDIYGYDETTTGDARIYLNGAYGINLSESDTWDLTRAIPEPATATLSLLALAGLAARRRRR